MSKVFISYRHDDSEAEAGRLYDPLAAELGREALYKDVENITIGRNWKRAIREALADSAAVLFVMGPDWRLSPPIEFELQLALTSEVPVVPIGERAWSEFNDIQEEIAQLSRSRGDSGDPEIIRSSQAYLNNMVQSAKARLLEEIPGIDRPGFTKIYEERRWPTKAFGKTKQYGR
jgi:hypothetical protein